MRHSISPKLFFAASCLLTLITAPNLYAQSGSLDPNFGPGGLVVTNVPGSVGANLHGTVIQADGKIVSAHRFSYSTNIVRKLALARKHPDGSIDTTFGDGGFAYSPWPETGSIYDMVVQVVNGEERFVIAGSVPSGKNGAVSRFERYDKDGRLDTTFGINGITTVSLNYVAALTSLAGGKLLAISNGGILLRLNENGKPDTSFGSNGMVTPSVKIKPNALLELPTGRIVAAGSTQSGGVPVFTVSGYNANGTSDDGGRTDSSPGDSFGIKGKAVVSFPGKSSGAEAFDIKIDSSGKLVVSGVAGLWSEGDMAVARMNQSGSLDPTFAVSGRTFFPHPGGGTPAHSISFQSDGKIVLVGYLWVNSATDIGVLRYNPNGTIDTTFGQAGMVTTAIYERDDNGFHGFVRNDPNCPVQPCERILVSGYSGIGSSGGGLTIPVLLQYIP